MLLALVITNQLVLQAMALDVKVNCYQWTENKLRRRCGRLALLDANIIQ